jgi:hypothetical protein
VVLGRSIGAKAAASGVDTAAKEAPRADYSRTFLQLQDYFEIGRQTAF